MRHAESRFRQKFRGGKPRLQSCGQVRKGSAKHFQGIAADAQRCNSEGGLPRRAMKPAASGRDGTSIPSRADVAAKPSATSNATRPWPKNQLRGGRNHSLAVQEPGNPFAELRIGPDFAFPNDKDLPAQVGQLRLVLGVPLGVAVQLGHPVLLVRLRIPETLA